MDGLPEGWVQAPFEDLVDFTLGGEWGVSPSEAPANYVAAAVVRGTEFRSWETSRASTAAERRIKTTSLERRRLAAGDLVVEVSGGGPSQPVGRVLLVDDAALRSNILPLICSNFCRLVRPSRGLDSRYIYWALKWLYSIGAFNEYQTQTTNLRNLNFGEFLGHPIPLPPLAEQKRIVEKVEALLAQVQAARDRLERVQQFLKRFRQAVLAAACDGRLVAATEIERITGWPLCPLADLIAEPMANGRSVPTAENGFPVLRLTAIKSGNIDLGQRKTGAWTAPQARPFLVRRGDFLVSRGNGSLSLVGRGGLVEVEPDPVAYPDTLIRVRPDESQILAPFLRLVWDAPQTRAQIETAAHTTAGIHKVSQKDLAAIEIPCPDLPDQEQTIERASTLLDYGAVVGSRLVRLRTLVGKVPQALLAQAFAGELVPTEAELALAEGRGYESGEELLLQIKKGVAGTRTQSDDP